jgi:recombination protein RecT
MTAVAHTPKKANEITDVVLKKVNAFKEAGELAIPSGYEPGNALKSAMLILKETVDLNKRPVLEVCTTESIANSLLDMVVQGLTPMKKQCYFIAYGNKLLMQRSRFGDVALAKRLSGITGVTSIAIYEGDVFTYSVDTKTGVKEILKHEQKLENLGGNVVGAYAMAFNGPDVVRVEIMNIKQIHAAWNHGATKGNSPAHKNFSDEMACKTVEKRLCKHFINTSDDSYLISDEEIPTKGEITGNIVDENANKTPLSFDDSEVVDDKPQTAEEPKVEEASQEAPQKPLF